MRCPSDCYIIMVEEMSSAGYTCPSFLFFSEAPNYSKERERENYVALKHKNVKALPPALL